MILINSLVSLILDMYHSHLRKKIVFWRPLTKTVCKMKTPFNVTGNVQRYAT